MRKNLFVFLGFAFACFVFVETAAWAQISNDSSAPVEISAVETLEWNRAARTYTARGDVRARQGGFEIDSDTLTASYEPEARPTDISELRAQGSVVIRSAPYTAYGDVAVYDVGAQVATLTGQNLRMTTQTETLVARDHLVYVAAENRLTAEGAVKITRPQDSLAADQVSAFFEQDGTGKLQLSRATATGNVVLQTAREKVTGDQGFYDLVTQKATITGRVFIYQGESWLEGSKAEVDLRTGISHLYASDQGDGRVKGVFYPKKKDE